MIRTLKLSVLAAALCVASSGFAADAMSKDDYKAAKDKIEADYKAAKDGCKDMKDNAKDVCQKQAKATEKIAIADLDYKRSGKDSDRLKAEKVKAEQDYAVAKEKCEDLKGAEESACKKEAKAVEAKAKADIKAEKKAEKSAPKTAG
ncbi:prolipoprotein diacylglyceryl transferase [Piscinibacter terrae]|uniref:Cell envelope biogenesis protein TolA n=1 Tax=Piscinibacter terrae TaxID=2496871 RepID=A0A3N7HUK6_9BURK|nr:hypothetical protein [Albitalea terrae]RQP25954.1 hypothetical protein DZC73_02560 [Albitalea terrae]